MNTQVRAEKSGRRAFRAAGVPVSERERPSQVDGRHMAMSCMDQCHAHVIHESRGLRSLLALRGVWPSALRVRTEQCTELSEARTSASSCGRSCMATNEMDPARWAGQWQVGCEENRGRRQNLLAQQKEAACHPVGGCVLDNSNAKSLELGMTIRPRRWARGVCIEIRFGQGLKRSKPLGGREMHLICFPPPGDRAVTRTTFRPPARRSGPEFPERPSSHRSHSPVMSTPKRCHGAASRSLLCSSVRVSERELLTD
ncbi:hypothetical protein C8Q74DRAFT_427698 [Fomes fomentarius]|nr:hypothetical protein C8Q74DRAFT_427698 [Fomes fomentarius]